MKPKAECTPDEWAQHLEYMRQYWRSNRDAMREKRREYSSRPEVKERRRLHDAKPEVAEKRRAGNRTPEGLARDAARRKLRKELDPSAHHKRILDQRKRRTGIDSALFDSLIIHQNGCCAICGIPFDPSMKICSDHCHDAKEPRGLLCHHCNTVEGHIKKIGLCPTEFAKRLLAYLANPPTSQLRQP